MSNEYEIYQITCNVNGKSYIGLSKNPKQRFKGHIQSDYPIGKAIRKHGVENFTLDILVEDLPQDDASNLEALFIDLNNTLAPNGYNIREGGYNGNPLAGLTDEQKASRNEKIRNARIGTTLSPESRKKVSDAKKGDKNPMFGKPLSDEHRKAISEANKGRIKHSAETRRKISKAHTGKKVSAKTKVKLRSINTGKVLSAETRKKISEATRGANNPNFGKTMSLEQRRKLSKAHTGKKRGPRSPETKAKLSEAKRGDKNPAKRPEVRRKIGATQKGKKRGPRSPETRAKLHEANRSPDYEPAHSYYMSLPIDMALKEKRRALHKQFPNRSYQTIWQWTRQWES